LSHDNSCNFFIYLVKVQTDPPKKLNTWLMQRTVLGWNHVSIFKVWILIGSAISIRKPGMILDFLLYQ
jgi:hypothetical protein